MHIFHHLLPEGKMVTCM